MKRLYRCLAGAALLGAPAVAVAMPVSVSVELCRSCRAAQGSKAVVSLRPTGVPNPQPLTRAIPVPGTATFDVPEGTTWEASAAVPGSWSRPVTAAPGDGPGLKARLELWPAGRVEGELRLASGSPPPASLTVRFQPAPGVAERLPHGAADCAVTGRRFRCDLPAGELDLRLRARGFVTQYRWGARVSAHRVLDVGAIELKPGASVVGWVEAPGRELRFQECKVEIEPQAAGGSSPLEDDERRGWLRQQGSVNSRGFFELSGLPPGAYRLTVRHPRFAPSRVGPIAVVAGSETELHPIQLYPPAALEVHLSPPQDPEGTAWTVALTREGSEPGQEEEVARSVASAVGIWRAAELSPGPYTLRIEGSYRSRWTYQNVEIGPQNPPLEVALPAVRVEGEVRLGKEPLEALIWFGGRFGARRVAARSDDAGKFSVVLPKQDDTWNVELFNEPRGITARFFAVAIVKSAGQRVARVSFEVPDTLIQGRVVDEEGHAVPGAHVEAYGTGTSLNHASVRSAAGDGEEAGNFELRGLQPGAWRLVAEAPETGAGLSSEPLSLKLAEDRSAEDVRLVLRRRLALTGHVVGPGGQPVTGAEVIASPELESGLFAGPTPRATTDSDGNFTLRLPGSSTGVQLTLFAPGFAVRQLRVDPRRAEPLILAVDQIGGTLVLVYAEHLEEGARPSALVRRLLTQVTHESGIGANELVNWAHLHGVEQTDADRFVIPLLEPGRYTACHEPPDSTRAGGPAAASARSCASGELSPYGELLLRLPKPASPEEASRPGRPAGATEER